MAQYALKGYEVGAKYYILKPLEYGNFSMKLDSVLSSMQQKKENYLYLKCEEGIVKLDTSDIRYIASEGHFVYFHIGGGVTYRKRASMRDVSKTVNDKRFIACGNSYLVNMDYITNIEKESVVVGEDKLPISRLKKKEFMNTVTLYFGGRLL
jgi:DNA-binding LytR/AlgR family response regulator